MSERTKHIFAGVAVLIAAFCIYEMFRVWKAGATAISDIISFPFRSLKSLVTGGGDLLAAGYTAAADAVAGVGSDLTAAADIPGLVSESQSLDDAGFKGASDIYSPGGRVYNQILQSRGQAAADASWQTVQAHYAAQRQQSSWFNVLTTW